MRADCVMRTILIWARRCSTWNTPGLALLQILARARQWESEVSILWCYLRQNTCKSDECQVFFAGVGKIFLCYASLW